MGIRAEGQRALQAASITAEIVATYNDGSTHTINFDLAEVAGKRPEVVMYSDNTWSEPDDWFPGRQLRRHLCWTDVTIVTGRIAGDQSDPWFTYTMKEPPPRGWRRLAAALRGLGVRVRRFGRSEVSA